MGWTGWMMVHISRQQGSFTWCCLITKVGDLYSGVIQPLHWERFPFVLEWNLAWGRYKVKCWCFGSWEGLRKIGFSPLNMKLGHYWSNASWLLSAEHAPLVEVFDTISPENRSKWVGTVRICISQTPYRLSTSYLFSLVFHYAIGVLSALNFWALGYL